MLEIVNIQEVEAIEDELNIAFQTRYHNYNSIKNHICGLYSTMGIQRVESTRQISRFLSIPKSITARVILQLEEDGFISKVREGTHPRQQYYIVRATKQQCFAYRCFYSLSPYRRKKFLENLRTCGAKSLDEITKLFLNRGIEFYCNNYAVGSEVGQRLPLAVGEGVSL